MPVNTADATQTNPQVCAFAPTSVPESETLALSVIIPSHNRTDLLALCLHSVQAALPPHCEIVVVDDASAHGSVSLAATTFPGVRVVRLPQQVGFARAANAGIAAAKGSIIELLNDDTEVTPGWADTILPYFDDPSIAAVAPLVLQYEPERLRTGQTPRIDSAGDSYDVGGFASKRFHGLPVDRIPHSPTHVPAVSAAAAFYRREAVLAVGGFPGDFGAYFEDVDLSCRLRAAGHTCWYEPGSVVWHRVSASYGRRPSRRLIEQQSCNEERVFWRNRRRNQYELCRHVAVLGGKLLRRIAEGTALPWLTGRVRGLAKSCTESWRHMPAACASELIQNKDVHNV